MRSIITPPSPPPSPPPYLTQEKRERIEVKRRHAPKIRRRNEQQGQQQDQEQAEQNHSPQWQQRSQFSDLGQDGEGVRVSGIETTRANANDDNVAGNNTVAAANRANRCESLSSNKIAARGLTENQRARIAENRRRALNIRRQAVALAAYASGRGKRATADDGCSDVDTLVPAVKAAAGMVETAEHKRPSDTINDRRRPSYDDDDNRRQRGDAIAGEKRGHVKGKGGVGLTEEQWARITENRRRALEIRRRRSAAGDTTVVERWEQWQSQKRHRSAEEEDSGETTCADANDDNKSGIAVCVVDGGEHGEGCETAASVTPSDTASRRLRGSSPEDVCVFEVDSTSGDDENEGVTTAKMTTPSMLTQMVNNQFDSVSQRRDRSRDKDLELLRKIRITVEKDVERLIERLPRHSPRGRNLSSNICVLSKHKIVTSDLAKVLHRLRELGNVAAHGTDGASLPPRCVIQDLFVTYVEKINALDLRN